MLTIYSIGRAVSSNRIAFPSVFCGEGDWEIPCRGGSLRAGGHFLVFGELRVVGGARMLALSFTEEVEGFPLFCRVAGMAAEDGFCEGWNLGRGGGFFGEVFAVDENRLLLAGGVFSGEVGEGVAKPREVGGGGSSAVESDGEEKVAPGGRKEEDARAESSEVAGTGVLKVIKPVVLEDFPVGDAMPELGAVKRDDLARKAEARRKDDGKTGKKEREGTQKVSKGGLRLGKDSTSDKAGAGGQNTIDESELW